LLGREADKIQIYQNTFIALDRVQACKPEDVHVKLVKPIQLVTRTPLTALATEEKIQEHNNMILSYNKKDVAACVNNMTESLNIDTIISGFNTTKQACKRLKLTLFDK
jgi:hypothetical protein